MTWLKLKCKKFWELTSAIDQVLIKFTHFLIIFTYRAFTLSDNLYRSGAKAAGRTESGKRAQTPYRTDAARSTMQAATEVITNRTM